MKYIIICPEKRSSEVVDVPDFATAVARAGLHTGELDFGTAAPGLMLAAYEFGLMEERHHFFSMYGNLYAGNAVLYRYDVNTGETVDFPAEWPIGPVIMPVLFLTGTDEVEAAITEGLVRRPQSSINGEVFWQWEAPTEDQPDTTVQNYILWNKAKLNKLKRAYNKAKREGSTEFAFEGSALVTDYAKYLIEFLQQQLDPPRRS